MYPQPVACDPFLRPGVQQIDRHNPTGMKLVLCSANPGKLTELRELLPTRFELLDLNGAGISTELPETGHTLEANAIQKARTAWGLCRLPCIADDTGLEVQALDGAPGVISAHYAGGSRDPVANMKKLLAELSNNSDRRARFRTVIAFVESDNGPERPCEGVVKGLITEAPRGSRGFGYDPVFQPDMSTLTFAEMDASAKNAISHRAHAVWKLVQWLAERVH